MFYIVILMLAYGTSLFCADAPFIQNDPRISAFLQKHEDKPPKGYALAAAAQTFKKDKFVLVFDKKDGKGPKFKVKIGAMQALKEIAIYDRSAMYDISHKGKFLDCAEFKLKQFLNTPKYLIIDKIRNTGVLANQPWGFEDIRNHNPEIPQEAWLTILK